LKAALAKGITKENLPEFEQTFMADLNAAREATREAAKAAAQEAVQRQRLAMVPMKPAVAPPVSLQERENTFPPVPKIPPTAGGEGAKHGPQRYELWGKIKGHPKVSAFGAIAVLAASGFVVISGLGGGTAEASKSNIVNSQEGASTATAQPTKVELKPVVPPVTAAELTAAITGCIDNPIAQATVDYVVPINWGYVGANNAPAVLQFKEKDPKSTTSPPATSLVKPVFKDTAAPLQVGICDTTTSGLVTLSKDGKTATVNADKIKSIGMKLGMTKGSFGVKIPSAYDPKGEFAIANVIKSFVDGKVMTAASGDKLVTNYNNKDNQSTEAGLGQLAAAQAIGNPANLIGAQILSTLPSAIAESAKLAMQHQGQTPITVEVINADKLTKLDVKNTTTAKPSDLFTFDTPVVTNLQIAAVTQASSGK
jgi:hypothetical protein